MNLSDDAVFAGSVMRHRRELRGFCYRMLGSADQADDAVQETMFRAWRARASFVGRATLRSWLYRIAANVCLDELNRRQRRARPRQRPDWLASAVDSAEGRPDAVAPSEAEPDSIVTAKESLAQACLTVLTRLTPRQRAVVILRDVLCWSAADTAAALGTSVAAVNSALQRARAILQETGPTTGGMSPARTGLRAHEWILLDRYVDALGRPDPFAIVELLRAEVVDAA